MLHHLPVFADKQFSKHVLRTPSYSRDDGEFIKSWDIEFQTLWRIFYELGLNYDDRDNANAITYLEKAHAILGPWILKINSKEKDRINVLDERMIHKLYEAMSVTELSLGKGYKKLNDWDKVKHHQEQSLYHAKQLNEGEYELKKVNECLCLLGDTYHLLHKLPEAKAIHEEAYIRLSEVHDPVHVLVLEAGGKLVAILLEIGNYYDAERFARIVNETLNRPPWDPKSMNAANPAVGLSKENRPESADIDEAYMLVRDAIRIIKKVNGYGNESMIHCFDTFLEIIVRKKDFSDEIKTLLDDWLRDTIREVGIDSRYTVYAYANLAFFYHELVKSSPDLSNAKKIFSHQKDFKRLYDKSKGPNGSLSWNYAISDLKALDPGDYLDLIVSAGLDIKDRK